MKNTQKILWKSAYVFAFLIVLSSCGDGNQKPKEEHPKGEEHPGSAVVKAPAQIVQIDQAKSMYDNYSVRRVPMIQHYEDSINRGSSSDKMKQQKMQTQEYGAKPFDVARFVSYDYKTIKQYMDYIEQEADAAGVEISTLRLYFSNYPDKEVFPGTKEEIKHPRQNSILLSPTIKKGDRDHLFYVAQGAERQEAVILNDDFGTPKGMGLLEDEPNKTYASMLPNFAKPSTKPVYVGKSLTMNRGTGAPPYGQ